MASGYIEFPDPDRHATETIEHLTAEKCAQEQAIRAARIELAVALMQVSASDDQIIVGHMHAAYDKLNEVCQWPDRAVVDNRGEGE